MKICYITTDWSTTEYQRMTGEYSGVGYYRAYTPAKFLKTLGHEVDIWGKDFSDQIEPTSIVGLYDAYKKFFSKKNYDIVILKQIDNPNSPRLIAACKDLGIPIVMDIDDNILEVPEGNPALRCGYTRDGTRRAYTAASMSMMDALFVSTKPLKDYFSKYFKTLFDLDIPIYVLPNGCDEDEWKFNTKKGDKIKIGWHGSITHDEDLKQALPALQEILKERDDVVLELIGGIREAKIKQIFNGWGDEIKKVLIASGTPSWNGFPEMLSEQGIDIGIAPLVDNEFNRGKSHIKWMEYALLGIPCIASDVYPYSKAIDNGINGIITKDWKKDLLDLINNEQKRKEIGQNAKEHVLDKYNYKNLIQMWDRAIKEITHGI